LLCCCSECTDNPPTEAEGIGKGQTCQIGASPIPALYSRSLIHLQHEIFSWGMLASPEDFYKNETKLQLHYILVLVSNFSTRCQYMCIIEGHGRRKKIRPLLRKTAYVQKLCSTEKQTEFSCLYLSKKYGLQTVAI
jgi:hypothetical protein